MLSLSKPKSCNCEPLQDHPFWADVYKKYSDYSADVWDGLMMVPKTSDVNSAISSTPLRKAADVSGVPGDLIKQLRLTAQSMFCILIQACKDSTTPIHILNSVMEDTCEFN
ncbi:hypothetical protein BG006_002734 [Podila minutissima]|uniref:Uncharacterized protein n=1 Tax=Podila minutissima TaxID=64525 RepID=A0A9P5S914_9FUNG|nr:hypothetical protein BG006_002734 [Podila minutissima]